MQIMCIRKGKRLVARILRFLSPEQAADVLMATARNLPFLIKKDAQDEVTLQGGRERFLSLRGGAWGRIPSAGVRKTVPPLSPLPSSLPPQVLPCLLRPFSHVLYHLPLGTVTSLVQQLTNLPQSAAPTAPTNHHLAAVLQNKVPPPSSSSLRPRCHVSSLTLSLCPHSSACPCSTWS